MKLAKVVHVYKKFKKLDCNNYRPISLPTKLSKIFEKTVHQKLTLFLEKNKQLSQSGFRSKNTLYITRSNHPHRKNICCSKQKSLCMWTFYRPSQSFQYVNHNILISKLEYYGICGTPLAWFKSYP